MKQMLFAVVAAALAGTAVSGHHSYAAYHTDRVIEVDGTIEAFEWINPHSLLKVKAAETIYTFEWRAPNGLERAGLTRDLLKAGDRVVLTGNPHREIDANGIVNLKSISRAADGWKWPAQ